MQVDINLLPQKKPSASASKKVMYLLLGVFVAGVVGIISAKVVAILEITELEKQVASLQEERSKIEDQYNGSTGDRRQIAEELNLLTSNRTNTTEIIGEMLGPIGDASMINISYDKFGEVTVITKFTQLEQVAEYEQELLKSTGISEVAIVRVSKNMLDFEQAAELNEGTFDEETQTTGTGKEYYADFQISFNREAFLKQGGSE